MHWFFARRTACDSRWSWSWVTREASWAAMATGPSETTAVPTSCRSLCQFYPLPRWLLLTLHCVLTCCRVDEVVGEEGKAALRSVRVLLSLGFLLPPESGFASAAGPLGSLDLFFLPSGRPEWATSSTSPASHSSHRLSSHSTPAFNQHPVTNKSS